MNQTQKPSILCVDDDADLREWVEAVLTGHGWSVVSVDGGRRALEEAQKRPTDVILLDAAMPDLDGFEVCAKLQELKITENTPVIFATSRSSDQDKVKAFQVGAADYLVKPMDEKSLVRMVDLHLTTSRRWKDLATHRPAPRARESKAESVRWDARLRPAEFARFKESLAARANLPEDAKAALGRVSARDLYAHAASFLLTEKAISEALARFLSLPYREKIDPKFVRLGVLPTPFCKSRLVVPVTPEGTATTFVLSNPFSWDAQEAIQGVLGRYEAPALVITPPSTIRALLEPNAPAPDAGAAMVEIQKRLKEEYVPVVEALTVRDEHETSAPMIQLMNNLIEAGYAQGASDIHIEPAEEEVIVRYRIDGDLKIVNRLRPARLIHPMITRLKIMANLDISEKRLPQDGRIIFKQFAKSGADFDLRMATAPMNYGEKAVLRILDKAKSVLPLTDLGYSERNLRLYREKIQSPYGMILHVGPTGSGKSMTLYSALNEIRNPTLNIQTAEDPIEYTLPGINQLQTHKEIGLTFARALRSFLRLDPDVILVGEIRDRETADIAIEASLTGHLLLSTLHTNDAASTISRFIEMGVEPYMVGSSLLAICAQRLLRRLCSSCKEPHTPDAALRRLVGAPEGKTITLYRPKGCDKCRGSGYKGRVGIHEVLAPDEAFRSLISEKDVTSERLKRIAVEQLGMTTLFWDAMEKVRQGICSVSDALANVRQDEFDSRPKGMGEKED